MGGGGSAPKLSSWFSDLRSGIRSLGEDIATSNIAPAEGGGAIANFLWNGFGQTLIDATQPVHTVSALVNSPFRGFYGASLMLQSGIDASLGNKNAASFNFNYGLAETVDGAWGTLGLLTLGRVSAFGNAGRKVGSVSTVSHNAQAAFEARVPSTQLRQQMVDAGFNPQTLTGAKRGTLDQFDRLFQGTLDQGKQFRGRLGNLQTRIATIEQSAKIDQAGLTPRFEFYIEARNGNRRFVDVAALDGEGTPVSFHQIVTNPLPSRETAAAYDIRQAYPDVPLNFLVSQGK